jgi:hypothetical protein
LSNILREDGVCQFLGISRDRLLILFQRGFLPAPDTNLGGMPAWRVTRLKAWTPIWRRGHIYFAHCEAFIKIGFALSVNRRIMSLQTASPHPIIVLHTMPGTLAREGEIIEGFADLHHCGEWFRDEPPLRAFITKLEKRGDRIFDRMRP